jgi:type I restriction enzyme, R subunit
LTPEVRARQSIDALLVAAGWYVQDMTHSNNEASLGVAVCEFPLNAGRGFASCELFFDGKSCSPIEVKNVGITLAAAERRAYQYVSGLPTCLLTRGRSQPFVPKPIAAGPGSLVQLHS